jgi:1-deoxy-D-xylulose-5-phosphate synthase
MLAWALAQDTPVMLRYPKGACPTEQDAFSLPLVEGRGVFTHQDGSDTVIVATGGIYPEVHEASNMLARQGKPVDSYVLRFVKPLDAAFFVAAMKPYQNVVLVEDAVETGGIAEHLSSLLATELPECNVATLAFDEIFYPQGTRAEILASAGLSSAHIADAVRKLRSAVAEGRSR